MQDAPPTSDVAPGRPVGVSEVAQAIVDLVPAIEALAIPREDRALAIEYQHRSRELVMGRGGAWLKQARMAGKEEVAEKED